MFDCVGRVADHAWYQDRVVRQLHVAPSLPFVLMTGVRRLEQEPTCPHLKEHRNDILDWDVGDMGAMMAPPADVIANAILREVGKRMVEHLDAGLAVPMIFRNVDPL